MEVQWVDDITSVAEIFPFSHFLLGKISTYKLKINIWEWVRYERTAKYHKAILSTCVCVPCTNSKIALSMHKAVPYLALCPTARAFAYMQSIYNVKIDGKTTLPSILMDSIHSNFLLTTLDQSSLQMLYLNVKCSFREIKSDMQTANFHRWS